MNKKILTGITSCALAVTIFSTGAAAQSVAQGGTVTIGTENTSFSDCVEKIRSVYTERYPEQVEVVNGVIDDVTSDKTFLAYYEYEGKTAFRILEDTLMDALTPTAEPYGFNGTVAYTDYTVPEIAQINDNYCGVAATQMALIGCGKLANNAYNRSSTKQEEISNDMKLYGSAAHISINITPYMNDRYPAIGNWEYRAKCFTINSYNKMPYYLSDALRGSAVPIMMVPNTSYLEYYKGYSYRHFMVVTRVDSVNKTITVVDPFHLDGENNKWKNDTFFGTHTITFDELFSSPKNCEDIWLSVYTYDTLKYDEYIY